MRKIVSGVLFFAVCFVYSNSFAMNLEASLYANNTSIGIKIAYLDKIDYGMMEAAFEGIYKSDDFKIFGVDLGVKSDDFFPGSRYKLGFKGVYADAEKNSDFNSELMSLCFVLGIEHDLSEKLNPIGIPVSFGAEFAASPEPLTFEEGELYLDGRVNINFHIMGSAKVILEYRFFKADFEKNGYSWGKEDHNFLFGYRLRF
ncbi:MAG: hypothetical protein CSA18_02870 [Deltaproteobacteria bacterium]|nr:MAG: hypothetical protein CSA18_02870 [Deltaproteobacteria bacterium]